MEGHIVKVLTWTGRNHDEFKSYGLPIIAQGKCINSAVIVKTNNGNLKLYIGDTVTLEVID